MHVWSANSMYFTSTTNMDMNINQFIASSGRWWDENYLEQACSLMMVDDLRRKFFSIYRGNDYFVWKFNDLREYMVKPGYHILAKEKNMVQPSLGSIILGYWKMLWKFNMPAKVALFIWKILEGGLPVRVELIRKGIKVDSQCPLCRKEEESSKHLFLKCGVARSAWFGLSISLRIPDGSGL